MVKLHFLLVEDQTLMRQLLRAHLESEFPDCTISEAGSLAELRALGDIMDSVSLAVIDLELPDGHALDWVESWAKHAVRPRVVILSAVDEDYILFRALQSNLPGFVHKSDNTEVLHLAVRSVLAGGVFFSPTVQQMRSRMQVDPDFFRKILTEREENILTHLGQGLSNEEVAQILGLKESSVADHRKNIMNKLNLHNQAELMRYAVKKGFSRL